MYCRQIVEPCDEFPLGLWAGDRIRVQVGDEYDELARVSTEEEWANDRKNTYPPDRKYGNRKVPFTVDNPSGPNACWISGKGAITLIKSTRIEESGQLLMF